MSYQMLMSLTQEIMLLDIYMYKIHIRVLSPDIQKSIVQYILLSGESESLLSAKNIYFNVQPCRFCVVISFFHPRHNGQWPPTSKDFYTRSYPWHYFLILILEKEPVFPFSMLSAKQGNYWYHLYYVFGLTRSLTGDWTLDLPHSMPALYH